MNNDILLSNSLKSFDGQRCWNCILGKAWYKLLDKAMNLSFSSSFSVSVKVDNSFFLKASAIIFITLTFDFSVYLSWPLIVNLVPQFQLQVGCQPVLNLRSAFQWPWEMTAAMEPTSPNVTTVLCIYMGSFNVLAGHCYKMQDQMSVQFIQFQVHQQR